MHLISFEIWVKILYTGKVATTFQKVLELINQYQIRYLGFNAV